MLQEFKKFIMRGNMIDLAVGVIIGTAFSSLVTSLVNNLFMPVIGIFTGGIDFTNYYLVVGSNESYVAGMTLEAATEAGVSCFAYGSFITQVIEFIIMAFVVFLMVKGMNKMAEMGKKEEAPAEPTKKTCSFCQSEISIKAIKCPCCTADLPAEA